MRFDQPMKNHTARYLLNNWVHYEKNVEELRPRDLENAKIFFAGLQMLTEEDQLFLASKHRTARGTRIPDKYMAFKKHMPLEAYKQRKVECETALQNAVIEYYTGNDSIAEEVIAAMRYTHEMLADDRLLRKAVKRYCTENNIWPEKYKYLWAKKNNGMDAIKRKE
jgi:hypothetical protein